LEQVLAAWSNLDVRRRVIVVVATVAMFASVIGVSSMASRPTMSLLYAGLEPGPAGEVVQALEASDAAYEIRGQSIFVDSSRRDELRMTLASDGMPTNSAKGYELLDGLTGFGTTSQMFDAAYWRAKEGELARTIMSSPNIRSARVHLGNPTGGTFSRQVRATASVTVTTGDGSLSPSHAKALKYLVASAVSGLSTEDVAVIDSRGGVIMSGDEALSAGATGDYRAAELKRNVERLLEARVGYGNAIVEVNVETVTESEQIFERRFDPEGRVAISSETEERSNSSTDSRSNSVTVASNLPDGDASAGGQSNAQDSQTRERINYEVSETKREISRLPGAVKRLSVAVLLDGIRTVDPNSGEPVWEARAQSELDDLRDLVASAVGLDETRGDTLTIKTLEFEPIVAEGTVGAQGFLQRLHLDVMSIIQMAVLAIVSLVLGLFVVRPILSQERAKGAAPALSPPSAESDPGPAPASGGAIPIPANPPAPLSAAAPDGGLPALSGEIDDGDFAAPQMAVVSDFDLGDGFDDMSDDPVKRLKRLIENREEETVEILRNWMESNEEEA